jgi:hypothetical protein
MPRATFGPAPSSQRPNGQEYDPDGFGDALAIDCAS